MKLMKQLTQVYPFDVELRPTEDSLPRHISDAIEWLTQEGFVMNEHWQFKQLAGKGPIIFSFKKRKIAMTFKLTWG